jgi:hypothetical protein
MNNSQKQQQRLLMRNSIQFQYFYRIICGSEARPEGPDERTGTLTDLPPREDAPFDKKSIKYPKFH